MGLSESRRAMREVAAKRFGYRCHYCGVPTGATIDHVIARASDDAERATVNQLDNLRLACPYCNFSKGDRPAEEWLAAGGARLEPPPLPGSVGEMVRQCFRITRDEDGAVTTGSINARLIIDDPRGVIIHVRPGRRYDWHEVVLGDAAEPRVVHASWDFLRRHLTPERRVR